MTDEHQDIDNVADENGTSDALAALFAVLVVVAGMIYWVSQQ